ncbi:hypothetical protein M409DRAFT_25777 [Zasmidium cellare ATCC 36951]|uniref:Uncharacterized protein n=1 Tax=Zasmidium cellare ATCC 36951 TaxID=1080233 RepID=A0A6A6CAF9_ZASCE|nr:uncharacterized protein M409DRAFT_25777 [Zasmidium cellare ATCC 36951]KAF2164005.1 hypothetical protein M409DRAFT_25777 [Zasmidium cellare ATCC 36951]
MQVKQDVRDVFDIVAEIPDNLQYVSDYVERLDDIEETVNNIESKTEDLSVFEDKINNIDENVDDIKQTCAEEGTLQTSMQMMNHMFDHFTNPVAPIDLTELLDQHTVMLNQIFKQVLRGR